MSRPLTGRPARAAETWRVAKHAGFVLFLALLVGLFVLPEVSLRILWAAAIPALPAVFLVNPALWRNVCPLATLNMWRTPKDGRVLTPALARITGAVGITLLFVLVPARHVAFNADGRLLAALIAAMAASAWALGRAFQVKAGFCNAICPMLPVERLLGQRPLLGAANARCEACTLCTKRGCLDLAPRKSIVKVLGKSRRTSAWLRTPFGVFAAAFPGFVVGYFTQADAPLAAAGSVYMHVGLWTIASYAAVSLTVMIFRMSAEQVMVPLCGLAIALFYWFGAPGIVEAWGLPAAGMAAIRVSSLSLVAAWLVKDFRNRPATRTAHARHAAKTKRQRHTRKRTRTTLSSP